MAPSTTLKDGSEGGDGVSRRGDRPALRRSSRSACSSRCARERRGRCQACSTAVLDVGCTGEATRGLIRMTGNPRFAWDCRRRFLEGWAETVLGLDPAPFAAKRDALIAEEGAADDRDLDSEALERLALAYDALIAERRSRRSLTIRCSSSIAASRAVYHSWMSERACTYRRLQGLDDLKGTAVMVQAMVFGNQGLDLRAPASRSRAILRAARPNLQIDVLFEAQGEDVVSGRRTPKTEKELAQVAPGGRGRAAPLACRGSRSSSKTCRISNSPSRTAGCGSCKAARPSARRERRSRSPSISCMKALSRSKRGLSVSRNSTLRALSIATFRRAARRRSVRGIGASGGVAVGLAAFDAATAERMAANGDPVILIRSDISTADVKGLAAARGIVTASGGRTAHAALIARQLGKACVVGCAGLAVNSDAKAAKLDGDTIREGDWISVDGTTGEVFLAQREIVTARPEAELNEVAAWRAAAHGQPERNLGLRRVANASAPETPALFDFHGPRSCFVTVPWQFPQD